MYSIYSQVIQRKIERILTNDQGDGQNINDM